MPMTFDLKYFRKIGRLTQKDLSEKIKISRSTITKIESGEITMSDNVYMKLEKYLPDEFRLYYQDKQKQRLRKKFTEMENDYSDYEVIKEHKNDELNAVQNIKIDFDFKKLIILKNQILTVLNFKFENNNIPLSKKQIENLFIIEDFINNLELNESTYNNLLHKYLLTCEEYLSLLIDSFKFEIKKPLKSFKELQ